jgi:hypothetical protein
MEGGIRTKGPCCPLRVEGSAAIHGVGRPPLSILLHQRITVQDVQVGEVTSRTLVRRNWTCRTSVIRHWMFQLTIRKRVTTSPNQPGEQWESHHPLLHRWYRRRNARAVWRHKRSRSHRRCWTARPDLGERWPSWLVATVAENRLIAISRPTCASRDDGGGAYAERDGGRLQQPRDLNRTTFSHALQECRASPCPPQWPAVTHNRPPVAL